MSAAAAQSPVLDNLDIVRAWAKGLAELLSQPSGAPVACEVLSSIPDNAGARSENDLWVTATLTGACSGELSFRLAPAEARQFAQKYEGKAEASDATISEGALLELFQKAAATVSTRWNGMMSNSRWRLDRLLPGLQPQRPTFRRAWLRRL
jgi:hypothetical protein